MFFSKNKTAAEIPEPAEIFPLAEDKQPIYVVGESSAALFLAARLQRNGENVCLVSTGSKSGFKEFTLKEEYNLQKNKFKIRRISLMRTAPKLIIFAPEPFRLKASLACISAKNALACPVIGINIIKDIGLFKPLFGKEFISGYLNGCFSQNGDTLTAAGREPVLTLCKNDIEENRAKKIVKLLQPLALTPDFKSDENAAFWQYFAPYSLFALNSLLNGKNPLSADSKALLAQALTEIAALAKTPKEEISRTLSEIPAGCISEINKYTALGCYSEINTIHERLTETAKRRKLKIPALKRLLKQCCCLPK